MLTQISFCDHPLFIMNCLFLGIVGNLEVPNPFHKHIGYHMVFHEIPANLEHNFRCHLVVPFYHVLFSGHIP